MVRRTFLPRLTQHRPRKRGLPKMKLRLALVSVLALSTAACVSGNALEALKSMQILEDNPAEGISYASLSGSGGNVTLKDVTLRSTMPAIVIVMLFPSDARRSLCARNRPISE